EKVKARTTMGKENVKEPVPRDLPVVQTYVQPTQFLGNPYRTRETICAIGIPEEFQEGEGDMNDGLILRSIHITPPDDDYVAPATNPILNKHLNEFREEFDDNTRVSKKIDSNSVNDLKELLKTCSIYKEVEFEVSSTHFHVV
ncbi:hypothetical protein Tco_1537883, partial [Tanacetum coccineum]